MEDAYNWGKANEPEYESNNDKNRSINDLNVLLLKYHAPDIYNTYKYNFNTDDGEYIIMMVDMVLFIISYFKPL